MRKRSLILVFVPLMSLWVASFFLACLPGSVPLSLHEVIHAFASLFGIDASSPLSRTIVLELRLCRVVLAALIGGTLALSGVVLQGTLRNPLAEPFTLGISAGAAFGASLILATNIPIAHTLSALTGIESTTALLMISAFLGAMLATTVTLLLGNRETSEIILAGIAVATFLGALVALIKALNEESVASIVFWIMGSFQGRSWEQLPLLCATLLPALVLLLCSFRALDLFFLGDTQALAMGVHVQYLRLCLLLAAALMTAGAVALSGVIGFVGLVVPHILRLLLGAKHGPLLVAAFFGGGLLLIWADVLARCLLTSGEEIPVGVVTALLGGPFFALLLQRRRHA